MEILGHILALDEHCVNIFLNKKIKGPALDNDRAAFNWRNEAELEAHDIGVNNIIRLRASEPERDFIGDIKETFATSFLNYINSEQGMANGRGVEGVPYYARVNRTAFVNYAGRLYVFIYGDYSIPAGQFPDSVLPTEVYDCASGELWRVGIHISPYDELLSHDSLLLRVFRVSTHIKDAFKSLYLSLKPNKNILVQGGYLGRSIYELTLIAGVHYITTKKYYTHNMQLLSTTSCLRRASNSVSIHDMYNLV